MWVTVSQMCTGVGPRVPAHKMITYAIAALKYGVEERLELMLWRFDIVYEKIFGMRRVICHDVSFEAGLIY